MPRKIIIKGAPKGSKVIVKKAPKSTNKPRSRGGRYVFSSKKLA